MTSKVPDHMQDAKYYPFIHGRFVVIHEPNNGYCKWWFRRKSLADKGYGDERLDSWATLWASFVFIALAVVAFIVFVASIFANNSSLCGTSFVAAFVFIALAAICMVISLHLNDFFVEKWYDLKFWWRRQRQNHPKLDAFLKLK